MTLLEYMFEVEMLELYKPPPKAPPTTEPKQMPVFKHPEVHATAFAREWKKRFGTGRFG